MSAPYGDDKLTHVNARAGTAAVVEVARELTGLPIEGYLVTGFRSFRRLVDAFGGVLVDVPFAMNDPKSSADLSAGEQRLMGQDALAFSRNRSIQGGDFTRSFHQGMVIAAGLRGAQDGGSSTCPSCWPCCRASPGPICPPATCSPWPPEPTNSTRPPSPTWSSPVPWARWAPPAWSSSPPRPKPSIATSRMGSSPRDHEAARPARRVRGRRRGQRGRSRSQGSPVDRLPPRAA